MPFDVTPIMGAARAAMKRAGLTERDVRRASGLDESTVRQLLDDCLDTYCRDFRRRFAQALGVGEDELWRAPKLRPRAPAPSAPASSLARTSERDDDEHDDDDAWSPPSRPPVASSTTATSAQPVTWLDVERPRR